eukprot:scaffold44736_cov20-Tisochrysis_lutea.AAC.1
MQQRMNAPNSLNVAENVCTQVIECSRGCVLSSVALQDSLSQAISALAPKLAEVEQEAKVLKDTCVHKSELKELENFLLDRINTQDSGHEQMRLTLDAIVADITKLAMEHGLSKGLEERKLSLKSEPCLVPYVLFCAAKRQEFALKPSAAIYTVHSLTQLHVLLRTGGK